MSAQPGAFGTLKDSTLDRYWNMIVTPMIDSTEEMGRLFPDSVLFGSLLLYVITQNPSFGVLSVFFLETTLAHKLVAFVYEKAYGKETPISESKKDADILKCIPGFRGARLEFERPFMSDKRPSLSVFFWSAFVAYMGGANYSFAQVLSKMGQDWQPRTIFAATGIFLLTVLFVIGRIFGCGDSTNDVLLALATGLGFGILFYYINISLFGLDGVNFNGLPILVNKTDQGSSIYVCAPPLTK
jgi:hypothetical protein